jgi:hypothetical protein
MDGCSRECNEAQTDRSEQQWETTLKAVNNGEEELYRLEEGKPAVRQKGGVTPDCAATDIVR